MKYERGNVLVIVVVIVVVIALIIGGFFVFRNMGDDVTPESETHTEDIVQDTAETVGEQISEALDNPVEDVPDTNPFEDTVNPIEQAETNPFDSGYTNPFE